MAALQVELGVRLRHSGFSFKPRLLSNFFLLSTASVFTVRCLASSSFSPTRPQTPPISPIPCWNIAPGPALSRTSLPPNSPPSRSSSELRITSLQVISPSIQPFQSVRCSRAALAMIFLKDNVLLERKLTPEDIKHRLLGHWGTCPGLVLIYAHLNRLIKKTNVDALLVVGPG